MGFFANLKVGTRIMGGYILALLMILAVGGLAIFRISQLNSTVSNMTENLAIDRQLANDIVMQSLRARLYASRYINDHSAENLDRVKQEGRALDNLITLAERDITEPGRVTLLSSLTNKWVAFKTNFESIHQMIVDRDKVQTDTLDVEGPDGENAIARVRADAYAVGDNAIANQAGNLEVDFILMRLDAYKYLDGGNPQYFELFKTRYQQALAAMSILESELKPYYQKDYTLGKKAIEAYAAAFQELDGDYRKQKDLEINQLDVLGPKIRMDASAIVDSVGMDFGSATQESSDMVVQTNIILITALLIAMMTGLPVGVFIARGITKPLSQVSKVAEQIAEIDLQALVDEMGAMAGGDLTRHLRITTVKILTKSKDEIGQLGDAFNSMIERLQMTGQAFSDMTVNLQSMVGQVADNANSLSIASEQLASSASQAGQATTQISRTVQQVAQGTSEQADATNRTAQAMEQMTHAIEEVAKGAQEQSKAAAAASQLTNEISSAVQQVAGNAESVTQNSAEAAKAAREGSMTVEAAIEGMRRIQTKVGLSAKKVEEMGQRSDQIGMIVETIDDIASQTNLLALNAAIEAARAGEHGKGFAVVADEVRKLAERSGSATKEINVLIRGIQGTVKDAVRAMNEGSAEVESGVKLANEAGQSLSNILDAAETVFKQANEAARATQRMNALAGQMKTAAETVASIVEENTASTEEMSANSAEVTSSIENIASVGEENSAAAEEVSASAEEMSAQVEEVTASAQSLAETALELTELVGQFKLSDSALEEDAEQPQLSVMNILEIQAPDGNNPKLLAAETGFEKITLK
jgi:methyl-accepting chemotaxis protein